MPGKKAFLRDLKDNKRSQILFCTVCMVVLLLIYIPAVSLLRNISEKNILEKLNVSLDYNIWFEIEDIKTESAKIKFSGWMLRKNSEAYNIRLVLNPTEETDGEVYFAEMKQREDIEEMFSVDWENGDSGFDVSIERDSLEENVCYEIQLVLNYSEEIQTEDGVQITEKSKKVATNYYLYNGEVTRYNPKEFKEPDVADEELKQVIREGMLLGYDVEFQIWIYQYDSILYYITNPAFGSMAETRIGIPVMPQTNQPELLPENRIQYGSDHLGFYFENEEYQREGVLPYQVVTVALSEKYSTTYLTTGFYDETAKVWIKEFNIPIMK